MDYILNILLLIFILLINSFYYRNTKIYNKLRRIFYVIIFLGILILLKLNLSEKEKFNQKGGNPKKNKIDKLKMLCGIPENDESTSHCFADGTHQTCCLLGPKARKYSMISGNEIGELSEEAFEKFKQQNPDFESDGKDTTPWCTCLGSRVCSAYAKSLKMVQG